MPKDIVIIPAEGKIHLSGSSTHHNVLTAHSSSITLTTSNLIIEGGDITAKNYIVSSSVTHLTSSALSGSTISPPSISGFIKMPFCVPQSSSVTTKS